MKAFVSRSQKGLESLAIEEIAEPAPLGPSQVRIAMRAASINYRDLLAISGFLGPSAFEYLIPVSDGAGEVIEIARREEEMRTCPLDFERFVRRSTLMRDWPH